MYRHSLHWESISLALLTAGGGGALTPATEGRDEVNIDAEMRQRRENTGEACHTCPQVTDVTGALDVPGRRIVLAGFLSLATTQFCPKLGSLWPFSSPPSPSRGSLLMSKSNLSPVCLALAPCLQDPCALSWSPSILTCAVGMILPNQFSPTQPPPFYQTELCEHTHRSARPFPKYCKAFPPLSSDA